MGVGGVWWWSCCSSERMSPGWLLWLRSGQRCRSADWLREGATWRPAAQPQALGRGRRKLELARLADCDLLVSWTVLVPAHALSARSGNSIWLFEQTWTLPHHITPAT